MRAVKCTLWLQKRDAVTGLPTQPYLLAATVLHSDLMLPVSKLISLRIQLMRQLVTCMQDLCDPQLLPFGLRQHTSKAVRQIQILDGQHMCTLEVVRGGVQKNHAEDCDYTRLQPPLPG